MAASVGYGIGQAISNPQLINMVTNLVVFFVLLFSPIAFPPSQFPSWLQTVNAFLPFEHMAAVVRASLAPQLVPSGVVDDYVIVAAWTVAAWLVACSSSDGTKTSNAFQFGIGSPQITLTMLPRAPSPDGRF